MDDANRADFQFVRLTDRHVDGMLSIFNRHIAEGFAAYPEQVVSEDVMKNLLRQTDGYPAIAVEGADGELLGFGFLRPYSPQATFAQTAQITYFLEPSQTGRGIGTALLHRLTEEVRNQGITKILAHISSKNPRSVAFHAKHGFVECGRFPEIGRKWDEPFDVVWMIKDLIRAD